MTRETKIGLIVAGSFLCLVCIVVASKMRHGDDPVKGASEEQTVPGAVAAVSPKQNAPAPEVKKKDEPPRLPQLPAKKEEKKGPPPLLVVETPKPFSLPSEPLVLPQPVVSPSPTLVLPPPPVQAVKEQGVTTPPQPLVELKKPADKTLTFPPLPAPKDPAPTFPAITSKDGPPTFPTLPAAKDGPPSFPTLPAAKDGPPSFPTLPAAKDGPTTFPAITPKEVTPVTTPFNEKDPPGAAPKDAPPTFPTVPAAKDGPPTFPSIQPKDGPPTFPTLPKDNAIPMVPPLGLPTPLPGAELKAPPSITIPSDPIKPGIAAVPSGPLTPPGPIPTIPSSELPITTKPVDQFIKMNGPSGRPMPIIRDTDIHVCQPGDTNFTALSQRLYGTPKYAEALLRYNRDNYKATVNGAVFLSNAPVLVPGQQVHVAPVNILERDYLAVRPVSTSPIPTIPPTAPLLSKPMPLNPGIAAVSNPPNGGQARSYVVQNPGGESILDIAERVMGDRGQWHKIWRVNPAYPPQFRIPVGTKLEIPAN